MDPSESPDLCSPHHPMRLWVIAVNISWHNLALLIFFFFLLLVLLRETIVESWGWASSPWCANHPYHHGILSVKHVNTTGYVNFLFRLSTSLCFCCQVIFFFFWQNASLPNMLLMFQVAVCRRGASTFWMSNLWYRGKSRFRPIFWLTFSEKLLCPLWTSVFHLHNMMNIENLINCHNGYVCTVSPSSEMNSYLILLLFCF